MSNSKWIVPIASVECKNLVEPQTGYHFIPARKKIVAQKKLLIVFSKKFPLDGLLKNYDKIKIVEKHGKDECKLSSDPLKKREKQLQDSIFSAKAPFSIFLELLLQLTSSNVTKMSHCFGTIWKQKSNFGRTQDNFKNDPKIRCSEQFKTFFKLVERS